MLLNPSYREFQLFLIGYIIVSICEIFTVGGFPLDRTVRLVCSCLNTLSTDGDLISAGIYGRTPRFHCCDIMGPTTEWSCWVSGAGRRYTTIIGPYTGLSYCFLRWYWLHRSGYCFQLHQHIQVQSRRKFKQSQRRSLYPISAVAVDLFSWLLRP